MYFYRLALAEMPDGERLSTDSEFKPNLVNTVCYMVQAVVQVGRWVVAAASAPAAVGLRGGGWGISWSNVRGRAQRA